MKNNQKGFGVVGLIILILIFVIIAGVGYVVYSQQKNNDSSISNQEKNQPSAESNQKSTKYYVEIPEWRVRFAVPQGLEDEILATKSKFGSYALYYKKAAELLPSCGPDGSPWIGYLSRFDENNDTDEHIGSTPVKTIEGYNYYYQKPQGTCYDYNDPNLVAKEEQAFSGLPTYDHRNSIVQSLEAY